MKTTEYLEKKSVVAAIGIFLVAAMGTIDYLTGPDYSLSVLYLIPVILAAWFGGKWAGVAMSLLAALAWLVAELMGKKTHEYPVVLYWNDFMELVVFLVVSNIMSALKNSLEQQRLAARTDHLTGIPNRRYFYDLAGLEINLSRRYQHPLTVVYIDIDNFKTVNDTLGHSSGDRLLRLVSTTIRENVRKADVVARLGGDEFALLLPETGSDAAQVAIDKVKMSLEKIVQRDWPVTFSIGMITYLSPPATVEEMIKKADHLMYSVKNQGKDMVRHEIADDSTRRLG